MEDAMIVVRNDGLPDPELGAETQFEGTVEMRKAIEGERAGDVRIYLVSFQEGARTHWHVHQGEQVLYVVEGLGRAQKWGEAVHEIGPGAIVSIAPGEKHWHGAGRRSRMSHLAVTAGKTDWMEKVDDAAVNQPERDS
jgi:quercetin dioxygenase-like cupin family protein